MSVRAIANAPPRRRAASRGRLPRLTHAPTTTRLDSPGPQRGIEETIYVRTAPGVSAKDLKATLQAQYKDDEFVCVLEGGAVPSTRHVRGSNLCTINVFDDRIAGQAIIVSCIDNLVKGASGQAVQNMNIACGLPEHLGLRGAPVFP